MAGKTLEESIAALEERLRVKKQRQAKKEQREKKKERDIRTRKIIIVGSSLLTDASLHQDRLEYLLGALRRSVAKQADRDFIADIMAGDLSNVTSPKDRR